MRLWKINMNLSSLLSVFRNGDLLCPPFRFIIPRSMRQDLEQILSLVTEKVSLRTGAVRRSVTHTLCVIQIEIEDKSGKHPTNPCAVSGCALWMEWLCPRLGSWRLATAMLPWEPRGSRNFHTWSYWFQKLQTGIVMQSLLCVCVEICVFMCICAAIPALWIKIMIVTQEWRILCAFMSHFFSHYSGFLYFVDITQEREGC